MVGPYADADALDQWAICGGQPFRSESVRLGQPAGSDRNPPPPARAPPPRALARARARTARAMRPGRRTRAGHSAGARGTGRRRRRCRGGRRPVGSPSGCTGRGAERHGGHPLSPRTAQGPRAGGSAGAAAEAVGVGASEAAPRGVALQGRHGRGGGAERRRRRGQSLTHPHACARARARAHSFSGPRSRSLSPGDMPAPAAPSSASPRSPHSLPTQSGSGGAGPETQPARSSPSQWSRRRGTTWQRKARHGPALPARAGCPPRRPGTSCYTGGPFNENRRRHACTPSIDAEAGARRRIPARRDGSATDAETRAAGPLGHGFIVARGNEANNRPMVSGRPVFRGTSPAIATRMSGTGAVAAGRRDGAGAAARCG